MNNYINSNSDISLMNSLTKFQGFYDNIYKDPFINGNGFIFVTKPLLFLDYSRDKTNNANSLAYLNMTKDPQFSQYIKTEILNSNDEQIIQMLSYKENYSFKSAFLPMFTNECKSFDSNDTTMETMDGFDTKQGYRESLPTHTTASEASNTVSISVNEDSNLSFTKLITLWVKYISNISDGTFDANPEMILNGALDYMSSIYYFVLAPDGKSIKYWCRYTGCWPTSIPYGNLRYSKGQNDAMELNINFQYTVKEDMNPRILEEFNMLSLKLLGVNTFDKYDIIDGTYTSIKSSPILNINKLKSNPLTQTIMSAETRDPLIFYISGKTNGINANATEDHFELVFDDNGYNNQFLEGILGNNYYINDKASNIAKNQSYINKWDQTDFWQTETIEER